MLIYQKSKSKFERIVFELFNFVYYSSIVYKE